MIKKLINSHDIHINGQQLRIVHKSELAGIIEGFDNIDLLLNEPRGSKYVNLFIYEQRDKVMDVEIYSNSTLDNKAILLKSFIQSLLDRGQISKQSEYVIKESDVTHTYLHDSLHQENIYDVKRTDGFYYVNDKKVVAETVDFELSVENITELKDYVKDKADFEGYLILLDGDVHAVINEDKAILAYPLTEAVSILNKVFNYKEMTTLNKSQVKIKAEQFSFQYYLISNSQFYIDDSDIYRKGFVIK